MGPRVVRRLADEGHEVTVFNRGESSGDLPEGVRRWRGDRRLLGDHAGKRRRLSPDVVLDMIPMNEGDAQGVMQVFEGIAKRLVAISSEDVYRAYDRVTGRDPGPPDPVPLGEDAPLRDKLYPYEREGVEGYEKILVERVVTSHPDLPGTVLRLPAVYGPGDEQHRLYPYLKRTDDRRPTIPLEEEMAGWRWTHGYVEDVAAAVALAVMDDRAAGCTYNVGEAAPPSWGEWVREIGRAAGWAGEVLEVPEGSLPNDPMAGLDTDQQLVVDTSRIRQELGYRETTSREEAVRRTVSWEREHPPAEATFDYDAEDVALARRR